MHLSEHLVSNPKSLARADGMFNGLPIGVFMIFRPYSAQHLQRSYLELWQREQNLSYLIYSMTISIFIYPITGHWIWGGGWLSQIGFHDFAGSTAVHMAASVPLPAKMVGLVLENIQKKKTDCDSGTQPLRLVRSVSSSCGSALDLTVDLRQQQLTTSAILPRPPTSRPANTKPYLP